MWPAPSKRQGSRQSEWPTDQAHGQALPSLLPGGHEVTRCAPLCPNAMISRLPQARNNGVSGLTVG